MSPEDMMLCHGCGEPMDPEDNHTVEAFEMTGKMLCAGCWEDVCEDDQDAPE